MPKVEVVHPVVATRDVAVSLATLVEQLGFADDWSFPREDGTAVYGGASLDGHEIHLLRSEAVAEMGAYIEIADVDAYREEVLRRGANPTECVDRPYGMRDFFVSLAGGGAIGFASRVS